MVRRRIRAYIVSQAFGMTARNLTFRPLLFARSARAEIEGAGRALTATLSQHRMKTI
jgi:hypothetical protein